MAEDCEIRRLLASTRVNALCDYVAKLSEFRAAIGHADEGQRFNTLVAARERCFDTGTALMEHIKEHKCEMQIAAASPNPVE